MNFRLKNAVLLLTLALVPVSAYAQDTTTTPPQSTDTTAPTDTTGGATDTTSGATTDTTSGATTGTTTDTGTAAANDGRGTDWGWLGLLGLLGLAGLRRPAPTRVVTTASPTSTTAPPR
ncbi:MYXO-CTERM domain-containing protein [Deinococcus metalli]|uniref:MYXO-CTERM domain-containing protein n=1 Tax=Deinococcus metalli TaxID=1141878 RepID=A0A7W8KEN8_9DEIO|nr:WGxxGxxG family protein [Deinococcus metalli]MBB5376378.1 MYXO-CTERM domain-containing protein [Deinococcus metalli]GHF44490.1 hypothetical protein GCM10017781_21260 [Deinococcus metalli]